MRTIIGVDGTEYRLDPPSFTKKIGEDVVPMTQQEIDDASAWRCTARVLPGGTIYFQMSSAELSARAAEESEAAASSVAASAELARVNTLKADAMAQALDTALASATPSSINSYVDSNVTDLASARTMLKRIILYMAAARQGRV